MANLSADALDEPASCVPFAVDAPLFLPMAGNACQGKHVRSWRGKKSTCGTCEFMHVLLGSEEQADA